MNYIFSSVFYETERCVVCLVPHRPSISSGFVPSGWCGDCSSRKLQHQQLHLHTRFYHYWRWQKNKMHHNVIFCIELIVTVNIIFIVLSWPNNSSASTNTQLYCDCRPAVFDRFLGFCAVCVRVRVCPGFGFPDEVVIEKKNKGDSFVESTGADVRLSNIKFIQHDTIEGILCEYWRIRLLLSLWIWSIW